MHDAESYIRQSHMEVTQQLPHPERMMRSLLPPQNMYN